MSCNNMKAIEVLFEDEQNIHQMVLDAISLVQEDLEEDATYEDAIESFKYKFDVIASEYVAAELFGVDFETYYDDHNQALTASVLQSAIDENGDGEELFISNVCEMLTSAHGAGVN